MSELDQKIISATGLTFDDVLLVPNYTQVKRENINISTQLTKNVKLKIPLLSSPMDTVTTAKMAATLGGLGGIGFIHRNLTVETQVEEIKKVKSSTTLVGAAVGVGKDLEERSQALVAAGVDVLLIDSAHGFSQSVIEATKYLKESFKNIAIISGNVTTKAGAQSLIEAGADGLRVGMGPGSICTTRIIAGIGVPQLTSILDTAAVAQKYDIPVIADGGIRTSGDIVKAIAAGASSVMIGSLFATTTEAPGKIISLKGKKYKSYRGMGSEAAMKEGSAARYGQEYRVGQEKKLITEGVEGLVPLNGSVEEVATQLTGGLRTGMYYVGAKNIRELQQNSRFIRISRASMTESHPHDIVIIKES